MPKGTEKQIVIFDLAGEVMGLDVSCVREILMMREVYPLPKSPDFLEGVINLREHIIAVMDLRKRFDLEGDLDEAEKRIIVCSLGTSTGKAEDKRIIAGLVVDKVLEVVTVNKENLEPTPEVILKQRGAEYISGIARLEEKIVILLNPEKILTAKETKKLLTRKKE